METFTCEASAAAEPRELLVGWLRDVDGFLCLLDALLSWSPGEVSRWLSPAELHRCAEAVVGDRLADALAVLSLAMDREAEGAHPAEPAGWADASVERLLDDVARLDGFVDLWADAVSQRLASIAWAEGRREVACRLLAGPLDRLRRRELVPLEDAA